MHTYIECSWDNAKVHAVCGQYFRCLRYGRQISEKIYEVQCIGKNIKLTFLEGKIAICLIWYVMYS